VPHLRRSFTIIFSIPTLRSDRVDGVLPEGCRPVPHGTVQVAFPTYGSSAFIQAQRHSELENLLLYPMPARLAAPKRIQRMLYAY
jgi:hypothetical protein